ncbi:MAG TPA: amino acid permease [Kineosporiaceae bacterium]|nr:amino acid permease [Kineosporiaceae bacterium]
MERVWTEGAGPEPLATPALPQPLSYRLKTALLGKPLTRDSLRHQRLSKLVALGVLASDCISSSAYGSEEMLIYLLPIFGVAGFTMLLPLTGVILAVLVIVTLSYRDVVSIYTRTGGSYVVARDNFGPVVAQIAAVALMLDYIVTVAIQSAAGALALTSAFPVLSHYATWIAAGWVLVMFYGNLRGIKEAGRTFAFPTYLFAGSMALVLITGFVREIIGDLPQYPLHQPGSFEIGPGMNVLSWLGIFYLLKAFANGGSSLTGLEAISNGVSVFRRPEGINARRTLVAMSIILGTLVGGVSWLAHQTHATPFLEGTPTVIAQVAQAVFGSGAVGHALFLLVQFATLMILWTGANTPFSGFPFLASFVAEDRFLPRQLTRRGHRLVFSNGIIVLTVTSLALLLFTGAHVDKLVAFYAIGVFTGFTLAGFGMAKYFLNHRSGAWRVKVVINGISGAVSLLVVVVFAIVKFTEGAWLVILIFPIGMAALIRLNRQYRREAAALAVAGPQGGPARNITRHEVILLVDSVDLATIAALRYARSLRPTTLRAVHFVIDDVHADEVQRAWHTTAALRELPLAMIDCPDRRLVRATMELAADETADPGTHLTLLLPRRTYARVLGSLLHDHTADDIARATSRLPRVVATVVPFDVAGLIARRARDTQAKAGIAGTGSAATGSDGAPVTRPGAITTAGTRTYARNGSTADGDGKPSGATDHLMGTTGPDGTVRNGAGHDGGPLPQGTPTPIAALRWRQRATVEGRVRSVRMAPMSGAPSVEVDLWDESGGVTLVFYGRRAIPGVAAGIRMSVEGMVGERKGRLAICNPIYRLMEPTSH